ncbi:hypothetical protein DICPUDRAFT_155594 [Dictyostelium purpureum]|uniref:TAP42-like protein n=1 Tax=Dictyostelium purpureum TaxID=5786 RepID=F0ZUF0_DICPU|nr:uncharacterized protein DICPUDRAFT_155594 [Dictyostelium purpureum]EGC32435.1 hypothetical protein DICPUDRAFT_155594 [Dictyostelium purpureum]|eukprot:XP_003291047.1 hypothetical protein DICPUDRAFT_155594 [Dictyostelium purpureum]
MEDNKYKPTTSTTTTNNSSSGSLHELTLFESFTMGQKHFIELDNSSMSTSDPEFQKQAKQAIAHFITSSMNATKQQIFSKNEDLEDIRTDLLKYLLIPYYLAELYLKITGADRLKFLKTSKQKIQMFLEDCERLELIDKEDLEIINRDGKADPVNRRNELISRNRRNKEIKTKLEYCIKKREELLKNSGSGGEIEESDTGDEELDRDFSILLIKEGVFKAVGLLETIDLEYNLLSQVEVLKEQNGGVVPPPKMPAKSNIGNFQILPDGRRVMLDRVFRPSHILPTLTPEQAAEIEMHNGGMVKGKGGKESEAPEKTDEQLDDEADDDDKLREKRRFDDYKDDNVRGHGKVS